MECLPQNTGAIDGEAFSLFVSCPPAATSIDFHDDFKEARGAFQTEVAKIAKLDYLKGVKNPNDFSAKR